MKKLSIKIQLFLFLLLFQIILSIQDNNFIFFFKGIIAIATCVTIDSLLHFFKNKKLKINESSLITGLIISFVLSTTLAWWIFILAGTFAIISKHLFRLKGKHIFNPAGFGIALAIILFQGSTQWNGAYSWYLIIPAGLYFALKIRRLTTVFSYFLTYLLISGIQAFLEKISFLDIILYSNYFFILVMLVEPKTSPFLKIEKIIFGIVVAFISFIVFWLNSPYDAELLSLLMGNVIFSLSRFKKGEKNEKI